MGFENTNEKQGNRFSQYGGESIVASSIFELHPPLGERYKWQAINAFDLSKLLDEAGITEEEIAFLVETDIRPQDDKGIKEAINFDDARLREIRNKLAKVSGKELIEA